MVSVVILAAGASSRLGSPKQNMMYNGKTLLQHAIYTALQVTDDVMVVLGANSEAIGKTIFDQSVQILHNSRWECGMSASLHKAIDHIQRHQPDVTHVLFMVCDQPLINDQHLLALKEAALTSYRGIVATNYRNTTGVPAIFSKKYFTDILDLSGDEGARKIIKDNADDVWAIPFERASIDVDTVEDYQLLLNTNH